jgi:hypothetical protein
LSKEADLAVTEQIGERDFRVAVEVAAARHAETNRRPAGQAHALELALARDVVAHQRMRQRRCEVDDRSG